MNGINPYFDLNKLTQKEKDLLFTISLHLKYYNVNQLQNILNEVKTGKITTIGFPSNIWKEFANRMGITLEEAQKRYATTRTSTPPIPPSTSPTTSTLPSTSSTTPPVKKEEPQDKGVIQKVIDLVTLPAKAITAPFKVASEAGKTAENVLQSIQKSSEGLQQGLTTTFKAIPIFVLIIIGILGFVLFVRTRR